MLMTSTSTIHHRRSIRLIDYDYRSPGAYFVTLVTKGRESLFGEVQTESVLLNDRGQLVAEAWLHLQELFPIQLDTC